MAEPMKMPPPAPEAVTAAVPVLEEAVRLLRAAPLATLLCHWTGSVPFALSALWFWMNITNPRATDGDVALESLVVALLLIWMNCWRAVYSGRLRRQLSGAAEPAWTGARTWNLVGGQSFLAATKLAGLPLSVLVIFPLAKAVAFYRTAAVLADRPELDPRAVTRRARELAGVEPRPNWIMLILLVLLQLVAGINIVLTLAVLPALVRMLTGYESTFSRSGLNFVQTPLFWLLAMMLTWLSCDPFVQAAYCVRAFRAESIESGEDLRHALRRIRGAAPVLAAVLLAFACAAPSHAAVSRPDLEKSIDRNMQSHEYDWRLPPPSVAGTSKSWIGSVLDGIVRGLRSISEWIQTGLDRFFRWLGRQLGGSPQPQGAPPGRGLHWSIYVVMGVVIVAAALLLWRRQRAQRAKAPPVSAVVATAIRLEDEDISPDRLPEESWLALAERYMAEANLRLAMRALYLSILASLGRGQYLTIHPGKTNREYERELRRRAREYPAAGGLFAANVTAFERSWYGLHEVSREEIDEFRGRMRQMSSMLNPRSASV